MLEKKLQLKSEGQTTRGKEKNIIRKKAVFSVFKFPSANLLL